MMSNSPVQVPKNLPRDLRAVLTIFSADRFLFEMTTPFVKIDAREIDWYSIARQPCGYGYSAAISWAWSIWCNQSSDCTNQFDQAFSMDDHLRAAVLQALAINWGLQSD